MEQKNIPDIKVCKYCENEITDFVGFVTFWPYKDKLGEYIIVCKSCIREHAKCFSENEDGCCSLKKICFYMQVWVVQDRFEKRQLRLLEDFKKSTDMYQQIIDKYKDDSFNKFIIFLSLFALLSIILCFF